MDGVAVIGMFLCRRCGGHGKLQRGAKQDPCPVAGAHDTNLGASRTDRHANHDVHGLGTAREIAAVQCNDSYSRDVQASYLRACAKPQVYGRYII